MEATIGLSPGAEDNALARWAAERIRESIAGAAPGLRGDTPHPGRRDFFALRSAVALVAPDQRLTATLRFDHGYLTIHDGMIGVPDVTFCGDFELLVGLAELPMARWLRAPLPPVRGPRAHRWRRALLELASGEMKVYGLFSHPRTVLRVLRLLTTT